MNRIYQGRVSRAELLDTPTPEKWDGEAALWEHHELFQDAVNYYVVCLLALAGPGSKLAPIREKLDAHDAAGNADELMVWRSFRRRGAMRAGLRDSVAKYFTPGNDKPTPEECFAAALAGNAFGQTEEGRASLDEGLGQILNKCKGESGCRDSSKEYLPRLCRTKTKCNYPESAISRRRAYHEAVLPLALHATAKVAPSDLLCFKLPDSDSHQPGTHQRSEHFNTFSIALPDYEKPVYSGDAAKALLTELIEALREKLPGNNVRFDSLMAIVEKKPATLRLPGYAATSVKMEKYFRLCAMYLFRYVEKSEFTVELLRKTTPAPDDDARMAYIIHAEQNTNSARFDEFGVKTIAKPDKKKPTFPTAEASVKLRQMVNDWREVLPDAVDDWNRLTAEIEAREFAALPSYSPASVRRADALSENRKLRLFAMYLFKYVERSEFTLRLLRLTTALPKAPTRAEYAAGDPVQKSRGERGFVFPSFTALPIWNAAEAGEPTWMKFDEAALQEALKALHQIESKKEERDEKQAKQITRLEYQWQCTFRRVARDGKETVNLERKLSTPSRKKWSAEAEGEEGRRMPVLLGDPRIEKLEYLLDEEMKEEYEMSEGVSVKYGLHQRTIRGFHGLRKKWNEVLDNRKEKLAKKGIRIEPAKEFTASQAKRLLAKLRTYQKENPNIVGSVRLFEELLREDSWVIWREPSAEVQREWRKAAKLAEDVEFAKDPLQSLTDERELLDEIKRLGGPIRFTPADAVESRRQFYFSDVTALDKKGRLRHDRQTLETEVAVALGGKWERKWLRIAFTAPRLLRDQINNTGGGEAAWQQAMMAALGITTGLLKNGKPASFADCAAVALMPEEAENGKRRILLNFPLTLDGESIAAQVGKAARWDSLQFGGADGESYWLRWRPTWIDETKERKKAPPAPWWLRGEPFRVMAVDLGQRDAGAFALLEASPGAAPKKQSRKLGIADGTDWWATLRATGMLRLPGEDAMVMREGKWQEEFSGSRGRNLVAGEWEEAQEICKNLGLAADELIGTERERYSFPELNDRLLFALRRAQSRLARLQSWSCLAHEETKPKRKENIIKQITEAEEDPLGLKPLAEAQQWPVVAGKLCEAIAKERVVIQAELLRIADRIQPLRGRRWEWRLRPDGKNGMLAQTERGTDEWAKLLAGQRGLSMQRIEQLEGLRQRCQSLNRALMQTPGVPAKLGASKRGIELPDPCPELLERLDALKDQRVNQTAHLILAQALGVRLRAHTKDAATRAAQDIHGEYERIPGREPVDFLVLENLDRYLATQGRSRSENSRLMKWCHRAILGKLKQLCEPYGLRVLETAAAYSSKFCSLTGCAGFRAVEVNPDDAKSFRWKKHLDRLNDETRKLTGDERRESEEVKKVFDQLAELNADLLANRPARPKWRTLLVPQQLGPIFVPMRGNPMQADINAAVNLALRAIASPDADGIHLRIRAARDGESFVVRAENAREKARWKAGVPKIVVADKADEKKLLADARLNFFFDHGNVATFDHASIAGVDAPVVSSRGLWGSINQRDWARCREINAGRMGDDLI